MQFERAQSLARATPNEDLCAALGLHPAAVEPLKAGERPMTIREAGALAELHGLTLLDVLAI